jgi:hypothetical protein
VAEGRVVLENRRSPGRTDMDRAVSWRRVGRTAFLALCIALSVGWLAFPDLVRRGRNFAAPYLRIEPEPLPLRISRSFGPDRAFDSTTEADASRLASLAEPEQGGVEGDLLRPVAGHAVVVKGN